MVSLILTIDRRCIKEFWLWLLWCGVFKKHPFNLKGVCEGGGGAMVFWGEIFSVGKFNWKKILSLKWAENIILLALCALKNIVLVEKK